MEGEKDFVIDDEQVGVENKEFAYFSKLSENQYDELTRLYNGLVKSGNISPEQFEERVAKARETIDFFSDVEALREEHREEYSRNVKHSLENFLVEEVVENGVDSKEISQQIQEAYVRIRSDHFITVNVNYRSLPQIIKDGRLRQYSEILDKRRDKKGIAGIAQQYDQKRQTRDLELGYEANFVCGALSMENGHEETLGAAPFYGHGVVVLDESKIGSRTKYFEGDSMTTLDKSKFQAAKEVIPNWLQRKWQDRKSRMLDAEGAYFSKALMEVYMKRRGLDYIHLFYVEAHVFSVVTIDDFESVNYTLLKDNERQNLVREMNKRKESGDESYRTFEIWIENDERKREEKEASLEETGRLLEETSGGKLLLNVKKIDREITTKEDKFSSGAMKQALSSDQLF